MSICSKLQIPQERNRLDLVPKSAQLIGVSFHLKNICFQLPNCASGKPNFNVSVPTNYEKIKWGTDITWHHFVWWIIKAKDEVPTVHSSGLDWKRNTAVSCFRTICVTFPVPKSDIGIHNQSWCCIWSLPNWDASNSAFVSSWVQLIKMTFMFQKFQHREWNPSKPDPHPHTLLHPRHNQQTQVGHLNPHLHHLLSSQIGRALGASFRQVVSC